MRSTKKSRDNCDMCYIVVSDKLELFQCRDCGREFVSKQAMKNQLIKRFSEKLWETEYNRLIKLRKIVIEKGFWGMGQYFSMYGPPLDSKDKESFEIFYESFDEEDNVL